MIRSSAPTATAAALRTLRLCVAGWAACLSLGAAAAQAPAPAPTAAASRPADDLEEVVIRAERLTLIGTASTASQGVVVNDELALTPAYRPGQLLETVPGLVVTSHSGEGKANQYLMRGFNLDHGTNLGVFVDGMPINEATNAHGQGYADVNFLVPELATNIRYTKGTYYADEGDFSSVGSVHLSYQDVIDNQVKLTGGMYGFQRLFASGTQPLSAGNLLAALEVQHYNGPWIDPDDQRKVNAVLRYSQGDPHDGYSLTAMWYHGRWNATTDQPQRAVEQGLIPGNGTLDPTDGGMTGRLSLSGQYRAQISDGQLRATAYLIDRQMTLWNNFTHYLVDPLTGDQERQHEARVKFGGEVGYTHSANFAGFENEMLVGLLLRQDLNTVTRLPTAGRVPLTAAQLSAAEYPDSFIQADNLHLLDVAAYVQMTTHWNYWIRSVVGVREEYYLGSDAGTNPGSASATLLQPKASLIFTPLETTELYVSYGKAFHSDDLRGFNQAADSATAGAPLLASQTGEELGLRQQIGGNIALTVAVFNLDAQSETTYNADVGQDSAGPASRRYGYEINATYQALRWLEFYASYSASHSRFRSLYDDGTGHVGQFLPNAPFNAGSLNLYVKNLGPWHGGLEYRYVGKFPLSSDNQIQGQGYGEWNGDVGYDTASGWTFSLGLYNILDKKAQAAQFWYVDRLPGEPAQGVADVHAHPLEPITARLTVAKRF